MSTLEMGNQQATQTELAWLSGIIDGEGSLTMSYTKEKKAYTPSLTIANTNELMISVIVDILNKLGCSFYINKKTQGHLGSKDVWYIQIRRFETLKVLLEKVIPYMVSKQAQAKLILRFVNLRLPKLHISCNNAGRMYNEEELELAETCRTMNSWGASTTNMQGTSKEVKIESELQGKLAELAEMTNRLRLGNKVLV